MITIDLTKGVPSFEEYCDLYRKSKTENGLKSQLINEIWLYENRYKMNSEAFIEKYKNALLPDTHDFNVWAMKYELLQQLMQ